MKTIKTRAFVNIALIKYWGKRDDYFNLPYQSSLSYTIDAYYTDCNASFSSKDELYIDGKKADKKAMKRFNEWMKKIRQIYSFDQKIKFDNYNYVPYASGLASSASAYASMALAINELLRLELSKKEISKMARIGSGSASRSIFGGFVLWDKGCMHENSFSNSINIDWPEFTMMIIPTTKSIKKISSRDAMKKAINHPYYKSFIEQSIVDLEEISIALMEKDIKKVGAISERNAIMLHKMINLTDINYFNKDTYELMEEVQLLREKGIPVYFTIDAGPHIKLITLKEYEQIIINHFKDYKVITSNKGGDAFVRS